MQAPKATSRSPNSHTGVRTSVMISEKPTRRSGSFVLKALSTPTCWALAPEAKEIDATIASRTASAITGASPPDLSSSHTARALAYLVMSTGRGRICTETPQGALGGSQGSGAVDHDTVPD